MGRKIFFAVVVTLFLYVVQPMLLPVTMGGIFAALFVPLLVTLERYRWKTSRAALLLTFAITLVVLVPLSTLIFYTAKAGVRQFQALKDAPPAEGGGNWIDALLNRPSAKRFVEPLAEWFPNGMQQLVDTAHDVSATLGAKLGELLGSLVSHIPSMVMGLAIVVVSIYFFLVDGRKIVSFVKRHSMFSPSQTDHLIRALAQMCRSVILASVVSGVCQAILETIFLLATGTPNAMLIGVCVFLASFIPLVGSAPVTFGVAIQQLLAGYTAVGIILLVSAVIVSLLDNVVRPVFLKGSGNLHPLLAFVAAFGGLQTMGFTGMFLGPIIAAMLMVTIQIIVDDGKAASESKTR